MGRLLLLLEFRHHARKRQDRPGVFAGWLCIKILGNSSSRRTASYKVLRALGGSRSTHERPRMYGCRKKRGANFCRSDCEGR